MVEVFRASLGINTNKYGIYFLGECFHEGISAGPAVEMWHWPDRRIVQHTLKEIISINEKAEG